MSSAESTIPNAFLPAPEWDKGPDEKWTAEEKVEFLYIRNWKVTRICRKVGLKPVQVEGLLERIDAKLNARVMKEPERVRAAHAAVLDGLATFSIDQLHRARRQQVKEQGPPPDPRWAKVAIEAKSQERKIFGLDAPVQTANFSLTLKSLVSPEQQLALLRDPEYRQMVKTIEEREHAWNPAPQGDHPGEAGGDRLSWGVEEGEAP